MGANPDLSQPLRTTPCLYRALELRRRRPICTYLCGRASCRRIPDLCKLLLQQHPCPPAPSLPSDKCFSAPGRLFTHAIEQRPVAPGGHPMRAPQCTPPLPSWAVMRSHKLASLCQLIGSERHPEVRKMEEFAWKRRPEADGRSPRGSATAKEPAWDLQRLTRCLSLTVPLHNGCAHQLRLTGPWV